MLDSKTASQKVLSHFQPELSSALIEYTKSVAALDTDFTIFMARKAARLHDLLQIAGLPMPDKPMIFHHVLEQNLSRFRDKTITLVDDTLILGTTLSRAKGILMEAGAKRVDTIVFATDQDEWQKKLIKPEQSFVSLNHTDLLSFCAAEVQALSAFSVPYQSDFPFLEPLKLSRLQLASLQSFFHWEAHPLSSDTNFENGSACYSVLPGETRQNVVSERLGQNISNIVDISKLRVYLRRNQNSSYYVRIVPIATLHPLSEDTISQLFEVIVKRVEQKRGKYLGNIRENLVSTSSRLRFIQYCVSLIVGDAYAEDLFQILGLSTKPEFSSKEAARVFGPWLLNEIQICHEIFGLNEFSIKRLPNGMGQLHRQEIPYSVAQVSKNECEEILTSVQGDSETQVQVRTLRTDLEKIFLRLHERYELPARAEVKKYGPKIFSVEPELAPNRNRLKYGFSWQTISDVVLRREKLRPTPKRVARLSLLLDTLIDDGIAVPFLANRDGIYYRAYRYGEDVPFANQEAALAYDIVESYIEASDRESVPRLVFEKLLVSLIKVGVTRKFLVPVHNIHGADNGVVRIGFHLHGAVANFPRNSSHLADERDSWLSKFLLSNGVFRKVEGTYTLGERPEVATISPNSPTEAIQIGTLLGLLSSAVGKDGKKILGLNDLIVLTTCGEPKDAAMAITAEFHLINSDISRYLPQQIKSSIPKTREQLSAFVQARYYTALNSARLKLGAYRTNRAKQIVETCKAYLEQQPNGAFLANHWSACWTPILNSTESEQKRKFDPWINKVANEMSLIVDGIFTMELALASKLFATGVRKDQVKFRDACNKISAYLNDPNLPKGQNNLRDRLLEICKTKKPIDEWEEAYRFGLERCKQRRFMSSTLIQQVTEFAAKHGRTDPKREFQYSVWYDIVDSTGQKSGLKGDELKQHRQKVQSFKERIIERITGLYVNAKHRDVFIYSWANTLRAKDDEKNLFFHGPRCLDFVSDAIELLLNEAEVHGIFVRIVVVETGFAGGSAFKFEASVDVEGEAFWEHGSRLRAKLKNFESTGDGDCNYMWLAGRLRKNPTRLVRNQSWLDMSDLHRIETDIENYALETACLGGPLSP